MSDNPRSCGRKRSLRVLSRAAQNLLQSQGKQHKLHDPGETHANQSGVSEWHSRFDACTLIRGRCTCAQSLDTERTSALLISNAVIMQVGGVGWNGPSYCVVTTVVCFPPHTQFRSEPFPESVPGAQSICAAAFRTSSQSGDEPLYRVQLPFNGDKLRQTLDCLRNNHWVSRSSSKVGGYPASAISVL